MSTRRVFLTLTETTASLWANRLRYFLLLSSSSETNRHLFVFPVNRSLTIVLATRLGTSWLPGRIIGPLLVFKVTQRQASASYIRKCRPSQEWNIWRWVGAAVVSRISWRVRTWQTGSRRHMAHRCTEWLRIIGPFLPFSASVQDFSPANLICCCVTAVFLNFVFWRRNKEQLLKKCIMLL